MQESLEKRIARDNPWWSNEDFKNELADLPLRDQFYELSNLMKDRMIISILGLRRTGKSTLLFQLLEEVRKSCQKQRNIFFFSFDDKLQEASADILEDLLNFYFEKVLKLNPRSLQERVYIFFDEIQYIDNWSTILKNFYDASTKIKFIVSGSFSLKLAKKDQESLAGRIFETYIPPLSFKEYLKIKYNKEPYFQAIDLSKVDQKFVGDFDQKLSINQYISDFDDFILCGNFPETIYLEGYKKKYDYIENSILNKLIESDIPKIYKFRKKQELIVLAKALIQDSASEYKVKNLEEITGINKNTINKYIKAFEESYLLKIVPRFHRSFHKARNLFKKSYVISPNFNSALMNLQADNPLLPNYLGKLVETYVLQRLELYQAFKNIHVYRKANKEIDFVAGDFLSAQKTQWQYIEVKYKNKIDKSDLDFLKTHLRKNQIKSAIVVSKDQFYIQDDDDLKLIFIPAMFLM